MTYELLDPKCLFLSRELIIKLNLFESAILGPLWPDLQNTSCGNRSMGPNKSLFYLIIFLPNKNYSDSEWPFDIISYETIVFSKFSVVTELYSKIYEK